MMGSMMRRGAISDTNNGPYLFGSRVANGFMQDLANGSDSLDIIILGDSNTGSAVTGFYGYNNGMSMALNDRSYQMYATQYAHTMTDWLVDTNTGGWRASAYVKQPNGSLKNGNIDGTGTNYASWTPGANFTRYGQATASPPAKDGWAYLVSGSAEYWNWYPQVYIEPTHPLFNGSLTLYHRVRWGTFNSGSGYFRPAVRNFGGSTIATSAVVNTNTGNANNLATHEYSFTPSGASQIEASWCSGGTVAGSRGSVGPVAIHGHSIYCRRKGWSVTSHGYLSGYDTTQIKNVITAVGQDCLKVHLRELYERQVAATGSGRVLIVSHSGINGADTATTWTQGQEAIWNEYRTAWQSLGYDIKKLAMLTFVGVQKNSGDTSNGAANLAPVRARAKEWVFGLENVTVVDMPSLISFAELIGPPYLYQTGTTGDVHLSGGTGSTTDGYKEVSNRIISALLS
jgi:hypothetical protein